MCRKCAVILMILFFVIPGFTGCLKKESGEGESRQLITADTEPQGEDERITKESKDESKDSRIDDVSNKELTAEDTGSKAGTDTEIRFYYPRVHIYICSNPKTHMIVMPIFASVDNPWSSPPL